MRVGSIALMMMMAEEDKSPNWKEGRDGKGAAIIARVDGGRRNHRGPRDVL